MAFMQDDQIWFPHCFITEVAQAVADLERGRPQQDPSNEMAASPTETQRPRCSSIRRLTWKPVALPARRFDAT